MGVCDYGYRNPVPREVVANRDIVVRVKVISRSRPKAI